MKTTLYYILIAAGIGQIFTALVYPYIRHKVFDWYNDIKQLKPLNQEIAKTYGHYIQGLNFSFGLLTILLIESLLTPSLLSLGISLIIGSYWISKIITQIAYYPMYNIPQTRLFRIGSYGMNGLFVLFALGYIALISYHLIQLL
jgi:hypothetical protein